VVSRRGEEAVTGAKALAKRQLAALGWTVLRCAGRRPGDPRIAVVIYHSAGAAARGSIAAAVLDMNFAAIRQRFARCATVSELAHLPPDGAGEWTACITFDDGYEDNYGVVLPLLQRHGLSATFFICTGFVDGRCGIPGRYRAYAGLRPKAWRDVRALAAAGMEIGAHTDTHPVLARLPPAQQEHEMLASKRRIEDELGRAVTSFALPYGNRGTYTAATLDLAARHFSACCTTRAATNPALPQRRGGMVVLDRVGPSPDDSAALVLDKLSGRWDAMRLFQRSRRTA
jgi:peptidoglycan/xylan/chitin deacetylase (PgdA/CDA1 family)